MFILENLLSSLGIVCKCLGTGFFKKSSHLINSKVHVLDGMFLSLDLLVQGNNWQMVEARVYVRPGGLAFFIGSAWTPGEKYSLFFSRMHVDRKK